MPVNLNSPEAKALLPVKGIRLGVTSAGIKTVGKPDLVLIEIAKGSTTSAVYTQNAFCAAPVHLCKQHQSEASPRFLLINSGNANAGTGEKGMANALASCQLVANVAQVNSNAVLPFSTGVIGQQLALDKFETAVPNAYQSLEENNWFDAAHGIMTTDTIAKGVSKQIEIDGKTITITGIAKGSGMIRPDMATMLAYLATDAAVEQSVLDALILKATNQSFNRITVDGDTSTNDAYVMMATGHAANATITDLNSEAGQILYSAIAEMSQLLAHAIVRDGEGATKFIEVTVQAGTNSEECRQVAYTVAHSPLVKTALFASDPNWGRILAAVGRSGISEFNLDLVDIHIGDVCIVKGGQPAPDYTEQKGQAVMSENEITITVSLGRGEASDTVWTCDFSYDYVKINAEYRT
jgi:glutamate N-acetyltransferase/amino-acid N-acetyltransferase